MKFEKKDDRIYTTITEVTFKARTGRCSWPVALRIDGRDGKYRVDLKTLSFEPWEAVDRGVGFTTVREAQSFARRWLREAGAQSTLTPRLER
jgi:hypothetical protein